MDFKKDKWTKKDILEYNKYLDSLSNKDKIDWTRNVVNTKMKVLAIKFDILRKIGKEITKGNYLSFLDKNDHLTHESTLMNGIVISYIKEFEILKKYLYQYSLIIDSWSQTDTLSFNVKNKEDLYYDLALEYISYPLEYQKRIGIRILFALVNDKYIDNILKTIDSFTNKGDYYVDMCLAWLLCECFIKERNKTLTFFKHNNTNSFAINKAISKCHDSYRVSREDKELLKKYKK